MDDGNGDEEEDEEEDKGITGEIKQNQVMSYTTRSFDIIIFYFRLNAFQTIPVFHVIYGYFYNAPLLTSLPTYPLY